MNDQHDSCHETVEDAARRDRLERAMTTRAARWCAEHVGPLGTISGERAAWTNASLWARIAIDGVWVQGHDPSSYVDDVWRWRTLEAWGALWHLTAHARDIVIDPIWDDVMAVLEVADTAVVWRLPSERGTR